MRMTPRTEAGQRYAASIPACRYTDAEIAAYMASDEGQVAKWLSFEADYHLSLAEAAAGL
jgi:hypothetical protein